MHLPVAFTPPDRLSRLPADTPLLVAFSGGADSRLLLELTLRWARAHGAPVTAAHLHHGIRGEEADRDLEFCRACAASLGIDFISRRVDIPALAAASGRSLEWEARLARYTFFADVMAERHIPLLLTAHHADDQLETLLLHLLRGSGTQGMGGIPPVRPVPGGLLLRPLLEASRRDILDACRALDLTYVTDSTNQEDDCLRNRLRHQVIPLLEELTDPDIPQHAATRLCRAAHEDQACLRAEADRLLPETPGGDLPLAALRALPPAYAKRCADRAWRAAQGTVSLPDGTEGLPPERTLTAAHLEALMALVTTGREGSQTHLPGAYVASIRAGHLHFFAPEEAPPVAPPRYVPRRLSPGVNHWPDEDGDMIILWETSPHPLPPRAGRDVLASAVFPGDLPAPLWARQRQPGDVIYSHGMTKKLKKLLCDKHIPPSLRDALPLICLPPTTGDPGARPGEALWYPLAAFRDGSPPPTDGACVRLTVYAPSSEISPDGSPSERSSYVTEP